MAVKQTQLQLVCHPHWMVDEMSQNSLLTVHHSFGLDIPVFSPKDPWWVPQAPAAQLMSSMVAHGMKKPAFISPTPDLLETVSQKWLQRTISTITADEAASVLFPWDVQFWKLATAKNDQFLGAVRTHEELLQDIDSAGLPPQALLQHSAVISNLAQEFRAFVSHDRDLNHFVVNAVSSYLTWDKNGGMVSVYDDESIPDLQQQELAKCFAEQVIGSFSVTDFPPAFVLDVALRQDGSWVVLEFNPAWCSAWYNCDIDGVVKTLQRAFDVTAQERKKWSYVPDPALHPQSLSILPFRKG